MISISTNYFDIFYSYRNTRFWRIMVYFCTKISFELRYSLQSQKFLTAKIYRERIVVVSILLYPISITFDSHFPVKSRLIRRSMFEHVSSIYKESCLVTRFYSWYSCVCIGTSASGSIGYFLHCSRCTPGVKRWIVRNACSVRMNGSRALEKHCDPNDPGRLWKAWTKEHRSPIFVSRFHPCHFKRKRVTMPH